MIDENKLVSELEKIMNFDNIEELWVVGSVVNKSSEVSGSSDIDLICMSELVEGKKNEFAYPDCDAGKILYEPEKLWGEVTEGVILDYEVPVHFDDGSFYELEIHWIPQPTDYDVYQIDGNQVRIY